MNSKTSIGWSIMPKLNEDIETVFNNDEDDMDGCMFYESSSIRNKTVQLIILTLHQKSKIHKEHAVKVAQLCAIIGDCLGLKGEQINQLCTAGLMHDIGKIGVKARILNKPGKLSHSEWLEIRRHPETGYRILSEFNEFTNISEYVLAHHEQWDGNGYPKGLKGEEIPLESRIIAIADAYEAMTSNRPYRQALDKQEAIKETIRCMGKQFDPHIANVFLQYVIRNL